MLLVQSNGVILEKDALAKVRSGEASIFAYDAEKQIGPSEFHLLIVRRSDLFFFEVFFNKIFAPKTFKHYTGLMSWVERMKFDDFHIVAGHEFFTVKTNIINEHFKH